MQCGMALGTGLLRSWIRVPSFKTIHANSGHVQRRYSLMIDLYEVICCHLILAAIFHAGASHALGAKTMNVTACAPIIINHSRESQIDACL